METCQSYGVQFYSLSMIVEKLSMDRQSARHKLGKLERSGLVTRFKESEKLLPEFSKGRPIKEIYYRNRKSLEKKIEERYQQKDTEWDKMWKAVRILRQFTHNDLVTLCNANLENVRYFTKVYTKAGYFRVPKGRGREKTWMIIKDTGPRRPHYKQER